MRIGIYLVSIAAVVGIVLAFASLFGGVSAGRAVEALRAGNVQWSQADISLSGCQLDVTNGNKTEYSDRTTMRHLRVDLGVFDIKNAQIRKVEGGYVVVAKRLPSTPRLLDQAQVFSEALPKPHETNQTRAGSIASTSLNREKLQSLLNDPRAALVAEFTNGSGVSLEDKQSFYRFANDVKSAQAPMSIVSVTAYQGAETTPNALFSAAVSLPNEIHFAAQTEAEAAGLAEVMVGYKESRCRP